MNEKLIYSFIALLCIIIVGFIGVGSAQAQQESFKERLMKKKMGGVGGMSSQKNTEIPSDIIVETVTHDGIERPYYIYIPPSLKGKKDISAFFAIHGGMGSGLQMINSLDIRGDAAKNGFAVVYPNSNQETKMWNDRRDSSTGGYDDIGYTKKVIADITAKYNVSSKRLFAAGISSGGLFSQRIACEMPEYFQGLGVISSNLPHQMDDICEPKYPSNMAFFMGTDDMLMPFNGGKNNMKILQKRADPDSKGMLSFADTQKFWAEKNGCTKTTGKVALPDIVNDKTTVTLETLTDCRDNKVLKFYTINGGGHNWPGGSGNLNFLSGNRTQDIKANDEMIIFFKQYGL